MALSLLLVGPFLEKIGLKKATVGAFFGHLIGTTLFLAAAPFAGDPSAFWILLLGAIGLGIGNGLIEVAGNPLIPALYPENRTVKLNHFQDRKSTRLNSTHVAISYAVFCLKKKN